MASFSTFTFKLYQFLGLTHFSGTVQDFALLFFFMLILIIIVSIFTLGILTYHQLNDRYSKIYHKIYTNDLIYYFLDQNTKSPSAPFFKRHYLKEAILDLLFVTKGLERTILLQVYKDNHFWERDHKNLTSTIWHKRLEALVSLDQWNMCLGYITLRPLLLDRNIQIRQIASKNLSRTENAFEAEHLLEIINDKHFYHSTIYEAIHRLIHNHPKIILEYLTNTKGQGLRPFILRAVGNTRMIEAVPALVTIAKESNDEGSKEKALSALGKIGDPRGIVVLKDALSSTKASERLSALRSLENIDPSVLIPFQNQLMQDPDPLVRNWMNYYIQGGL